MSRFAALSFAVTFAFVAPAAAQTAIQAADVYNTRLGRDVTLQGHIVEHIRDDYYRFQDASGTVRIELEWNVRRNRTFTPDTLVRIRGEVDRNLFFRYISVDRLTILD